MNERRKGGMEARSCGQSAQQRIVESKGFIVLLP